MRTGRAPRACGIGLGARVIWSLPPEDLRSTIVSAPRTSCTPPPRDPDDDDEDDDDADEEEEEDEGGERPPVVREPDPED